MIKPQADASLGAASNPRPVEPSLCDEPHPALIRRDTRIAFFGFYGRHNFGDDLFGYLLQSISVKTLGIQPWIVGASCAQELTHSFHLPVAKSLWARPGAIGAAARSVTYVVAISRAKAAIFGGGSLFGANASLPFARLIVNVSRWFNRPVAALGVSAGPFATPERRDAFAGVLKDIPSIAVRDEASVRAVAGCTGSAPANLKDLAFALPAIYTPKRRPDDSRTLVVSIHLRQYMDTVLAILADVDSRRLVDEVLFASLDEESVAVTGDIARLFSPSNVSVSRFRYGDSITEVVDLLASATCVVTSKLHGAIVSFVYDVPVMLFCYQPKCAEFLRDNALAGPRETQPLNHDCIRHVTELLVRGRHEQGYSSAEWHLDQFRDFIAGMGKKGNSTGAA
ncbi:polysaccharide pyruvyl transferase family protein [Paraburkholderia terricola]|uniref:Polysaccharide pyruvyl transferase WcaK-like protein n=1 Tax=Paraburkholderia terricola TaxID=169427 RepID=A0ABU1LKL1_9BURK|nr:polysaccharide pyruvyl transferase family protein [Paraburkholderia terricola]MDR6407090.1 polysaccharide pyruvyl transferase WcaK-like protein [Paraburkholderia terricola]MDR6479232.1 polysaccharide pyruvyl transferase WcaK-like protein [Paraburkholderia terricola]